MKTRLTFIALVFCSFFFTPSGGMAQVPEESKLQTVFSADDWSSYQSALETKKDAAKIFKKTDDLFKKATALKNQAASEKSSKNQKKILKQAVDTETDAKKSGIRALVVLKDCNKTRIDLLQANINRLKQTNNAVTAAKLEKDTEKLLADAAANRKTATGLELDQKYKVLEAAERFEAIAIENYMKMFAIFLKWDGYQQYTEDVIFDAVVDSDRKEKIENKSRFEPDFKTDTLLRSASDELRARIYTYLGYDTAKNTIFFSENGKMMRKDQSQAVVQKEEQRRQAYNDSVAYATKLKVRDSIAKNDGKPHNVKYTEGDLVIMINPDTPPGKVVFRVQVASDVVVLSQRKLRKVYKKNFMLIQTYQDSWYRYSIGEFDNYADAAKLRNESGVVGAFIVAFLDGTQIDIKEALNRTQKITN